jgi:ubiquinone/menaquinone biosynthesis C-methylase UbiE
MEVVHGVCVMVEGRSRQKGSLNVAQVFDVFAERYDAWYDKPFGKSAFNLEKACIASLCKNLRQPFLEIGVGTGRFTEALKIKYGIDNSVGVLRFAKKRGVTVIRGKGEKLPFPNRSFGAVFIIVTLCFVDEPIKALEEASRVLRDDGCIILGLILRESPWASFYMRKGTSGNVFYKVVRFYSLNELKVMLQKTNLRIAEASSTIFQAPTEKPLRFENPRKDHYKDAGFVAMKVRKLK